MSCLYGWLKALYDAFGRWASIIQYLHYLFAARKGGRPQSEPEVHLYFRI